MTSNVTRGSSLVTVTESPGSPKKNVQLQQKNKLLYMSTWWGFSAPPWWSLHHPHLSVPYIFPVILNMQNISVSLRKVPGFKDSNSISVSFNFFAKRKVKRKEKRCNSRKVIALPNSLPPVGPRDQDESLSFVRWFLFLFRLEREAGEEDGNMFPI